MLNRNNANLHVDNDSVHLRKSKIYSRKNQTAVRTSSKPLAECVTMDTQDQKYLRQAIEIFPLKLIRTSKVLCLYIYLYISLILMHIHHSVREASSTHNSDELDKWHESQTQKS